VATAMDAIEAEHASREFLHSQLTERRVIRDPHGRARAAHQELLTDCRRPRPLVDSNYHCSEGDSLLMAVATKWSINNSHHIAWVWFEALLGVPACPVDAMNAALLRWAGDKRSRTAWRWSC
jgi:hypothetical protein